MTIPQYLVVILEIVGILGWRYFMSRAQNPLRRELAFYEQHKSEWLPRHENQFVVVAGVELAGFYNDYESAWQAGTKQFGLQASFLIKQICLHEPVYFLY